MKERVDSRDGGRPKAYWKAWLWGWVILVFLAYMAQFGDLLLRLFRALV